MKNKEERKLNELLKNMPKPSLNRQKRNEIQQAIMNSKKSPSIKKYTPIFGAVAAGFLFFLLIFTSMNNNQQASIHSYNDIVKEEISMIEGSNQENSYSSKDKSIIKVFHKTIGSMKFAKTNKTSSVFEKTIKLYNSDQDMFATMIFTGKNIATLNGKQYKIHEKELKQFTNEFFTEKYKADDENKSSIKKQANEVLRLLADQNMEALANHVHPEKGLLFAPYVYVKPNAITFSQDEIAGLLEDTKVYNWGSQAASGKPIELRPNKYFDKYVNASAFTKADEVNLNKQTKLGITLNNIREVFPNAQTVEFYHEGTKEELNWGSLTLVFEDVDGSRKLVALVHNEWTP